MRVKLFDELPLNDVIEKSEGNNFEELPYHERDIENILYDNVFECEDYVIYKTNQSLRGTIFAYEIRIRYDESDLDSLHNIIKGKLKWLMKKSLENKEGIKSQILLEGEYIVSIST